MTVLVGFDGTPCGQDALGLAQLLAQLSDEPLLVVAVWPGDEAGVGVALHDAEWVGTHRAQAEAMLDTARALLPGTAQVSFETAGPSSASRGLHDLAEQRSATAIVVGSSADTVLGRISPDSTGERLLHGAPCPVAVAPRGYRFHGSDPASLCTIAVAFVDTDEARRALELAARIAARSQATLRLLTVSDRPDQATTAQLNAEAAALTPPDTPAVEVLTGHDPAAALAERSAQGVDLLVCGSRGYGPLRSVLLGGVSRRLIRTASCPVLVVPRGAGPERQTAPTVHVGKPITAEDVAAAADDA